MPTSQERAAIVTGASRGIGRATAELLGSHGIRVAVNYRKDAAGAEATVRAIESRGGAAVAVPADVTRPAEIARLFDAAEARFGRVDILVNNAGLLLNREIAAITEEDYARVFDANVKSVFFAMKEAAARLADNGCVVNLSSTTTRTIFPGYGLYAAAKAAVEQATKIFAKEMGRRGITVNAVLPGPTRTQLMLAGKTEADLERLAAASAFNRLGEPEDIARVILFLVSPEARWVSAQCLGVNGGFV